MHPAVLDTYGGTKHTCPSFAVDGCISPRRPSIFPLYHHYFYESQQVRSPVLSSS